MNSIALKIRQKAKKENTKKESRIILTEPEDSRVLRAAVTASKLGIAKIILIGKPEKILIKARKEKITLDLKKIEIIDHKKDAKREDYAKLITSIRKKKGVTKDKAMKILNDKMYFTCAMVLSGRAEGVVSGATHTTAETWRPALQLIKTKEGFASSSFLMLTKLEGKERPFIFGDCALNILPTSKELAKIAEQSAKTFNFLVGERPKVALISFSTKGSGYDESIERIRKAARIARKNKKGYIIDGEVQVDEAIVKNVAEIKCPTCSIKGNANVLIFPDLNSGNIGYKLVERFGNATAIGPIMQGLKRPVNDLSRGCKTEEIVDVIAITVLQARQK